MVSSSLSIDHNRGHSTEGHPLQMVSIWHFGYTPRAGCHTKDTPSEEGLSPVSQGSHLLVCYTLFLKRGEASKDPLVTQM